jgi:hypothetical protein
MSTIQLQALKRLTLSPRIRPETYIAVLSSNGITKIGQSIFQCRDTLRKKMQEYGHVVPKKPQHCPYSLEPKQFGSKAQRPLLGDTSPLLDDKGKKRIQKFVGSILYYACAVDMMVLMALSTIMMSQAKPMENTMEHCVQLLITLQHMPM